VHKMSTKKSRLQCLQYTALINKLWIYFFIVTIPNNIVALQFSRKITNINISIFFLFFIKFHFKVMKNKQNTKKSLSPTYYWINYISKINWVFGHMEAMNCRRKSVCTLLKLSLFNTKFDISTQHINSKLSHLISLLN